MLFCVAGVNVSCDWHESYGQPDHSTELLEVINVRIAAELFSPQTNFICSLKCCVDGRA